MKMKPQIFFEGSAAALVTHAGNKTIIAAKQMPPFHFVVLIQRRPVFAFELLS